MGGKFESLRIEYQDVLRKSFKTGGTDLIETKVKQLTKTAVDLKSPLDQALRDILLELLEQEVNVSVLKELVDFSVSTCRKELSNPTMPVVLLSDIFDALTLDTCQEMFLYVENNVEVWKENLFFSCCKNNLLRLCNDLLRRLSRSTATVFCGRILLFLAKFFPFSERSGLNIVSEFNLENVTEYGSDASQDVPEIVEASTSSTDSKKNVIDFTFYCKFWSLQDFFRNPNQLYNKANWKLFCSYGSSVLSTFQGLKLEHVASGGAFGGELKNKLYFSKYLTSQKLLDLQLYDVNFRRAVLLQFLILFQYLLSSVKFKSDSFELKPDQKEWIQSSSDKVYSLLKETPPDGKNFAEIVSNILTREELWNAWKNDGCPEVKKPTLENTVDRKKPERPFLGDLIKEATEQKKYYMGSPELTKLWNLCPDNLEACKGKERDFLPTLDDYFSDAIAQVESAAAAVKDEDNLLKDGNFGWRALRLLAKRSPHFFTYSTVIMNPLSSYLEMMVCKIAQERPGRVPSADNSQESQQPDAEEENLFKDTQVDESAEDIKPSEEFIDDANARIDHKNVSPNQLQVFADKVAPDWQKLATKLGFKADEIQFFTQEHANETDRAKAMLQLWFDDDEDATLDNFVYILDGLEMEDAAEAVRIHLNSIDN